MLLIRHSESPRSYRSSDAVTVRAQVDVANNMVWGGVTSGFFGDNDSVVLSDLRPSGSLQGCHFDWR